MRATVREKKKKKKKNFSNALPNIPLNSNSFCFLESPPFHHYILCNLLFILIRNKSFFFFKKKKNLPSSLPLWRNVSDPTLHPWIHNFPFSTNFPFKPSSPEKNLCYFLFSFIFLIWPTTLSAIPSPLFIYFFSLLSSPNPRGILLQKKKKKKSL